VAVAGDDPLCAAPLRRVVIFYLVKAVNSQRQRFALGGGLLNFQYETASEQAIHCAAKISELLKAQCRSLANRNFQGRRDGDRAWRYIHCPTIKSERFATGIASVGEYDGARQTYRDPDFGPAFRERYIVCFLHRHTRRPRRSCDN
jgi:hypothetical protein